MKNSIVALLSGIAIADVAPVALFHGVNDSCPQNSWTNLISEGIGGQAVVKCVEIGDGRISSIFERMEWQID
jgi:hypothetical protein